MKLTVYSVLDCKAGAYGTPFFSVKDSMAIRMFSDLANDPKSTVYRHPEDFTLYKIGEWLDDSAELLELKNEVVCTASNVKEPEVVPDLPPEVRKLIEAKMKPSNEVAKK